MLPGLFAFHQREDGGMVQKTGASGLKVGSAPTGLGDTFDGIGPFGRGFDASVPKITRPA